MNLLAPGIWNLSLIVGLVFLFAAWSWSGADE